VRAETSMTGRLAPGRALVSLALVACIPLCGALVVSCSESRGQAVGAPTAYGPGTLVLCGTSGVDNVRTTLPPGGNANQWSHGALLNELSFQSQAAMSCIPARLVAGKPYTFTVRMQTVDPALGGDNKGAPLQGGNLVLDVEWVFAPSSNWGGVNVRQAALISLPIPSGRASDTELTVTGTVPAAPQSAGGLQTTALSVIWIRVNPATTAQGQGLGHFEFVVGP